MFTAHAQNYLIDNMAFVLSLVPVALLSTLIAGSVAASRKRRFGSIKNLRKRTR